jgi:hypothetical protein
VTDTWRVAGTYFESCNCDAVCPCRMVSGTRGGRSTHGLCFGALSWAIESGHAGDVDLAGLAVAMVIRYHDDEPGSPWTLVLHVDERATREQHELLRAIFLGEAGGEHMGGLPWVRKAVESVAVRSSPIEIRHEGGGHELRVGSSAELRATRSAASSPATSGSARSCTPTTWSCTGRSWTRSCTGTARSWRTSSTPAHSAALD